MTFRFVLGGVLRAARRRVVRALCVPCGAAPIAVALFAWSAATPLRAAAQPSVVVLVRHGEKEALPADDPSLSPAGVARAQALADALRDATPTAVIVTARKRTAETGAPVAKQAGVTPIVIDLTGPHVKNVVEAIMKQTGMVVVVGHSNTVPAIITALGGPKMPDLCDASYATLFVFTPPRAGQPAHLVKGTYGAADALTAANCPGMVPR